MYIVYTPPQIVHKKTTYVLCLATVKNEDKLHFSKILEAIKEKHRENEGKLPSKICNGSNSGNSSHSLALFQLPGDDLELQSLL
ncbi:hypothetical protein V6N12_045981 [Hibiscus sabdariffa]|uniref:MULE transposase domain-containing protein n=1 Tax=Hibiscus sabdariffa TaxID=183260 RepID=A0ABR2G4M3_9ROSI